MHIPAGLLPDFRKWMRFPSSLTLSVLAPCIFTATLSMAGDTPPVMDEIVVSPPTVRSLDIPGAETRIVGREQIRASGASDIPDLLERLAGVDIISRGTPGSQADITIRGSSAESVLVLVNGIRASDPQTGHFTMNIPVDLASVERIEVMTGGGSSVFGPSAAGGVVNIVTSGGESAGQTGGFRAGSHATGEARVAMASVFGRSRVMLAASGIRSDGYRSGSGLSGEGLAVSGEYEASGLSLLWNTGYRSRRFGAADFYGPYPSYEETMTVQGGLNARMSLPSGSAVRLRAGARGHGDDFILVRDDPERYSNTHYNRSYSLAAEYLGSGGGLAYTAGMEIERLGITSPGLGNHGDDSRAVYGDVSLQRGSITGVMSGRLHHDRRNGLVICPGFGLESSLSGDIDLAFRAERSYRTPTYTERYYTSPANRGDPDLKSERSWSMETGASITKAEGAGGVTVFFRSTADAVDWIRRDGETLWRAANHGRIGTTGLSLHGKHLLSRTWRAGLEVLHLRQWVSGRKGTESKYALDPVEFAMVPSLAGVLPGAVSVSFSARYERRAVLGRSFPATVFLSRDIMGTVLSLTVRNVFDDRYDSIPGLPAPGRWLTVALDRSF